MYLADNVIDRIGECIKADKIYTNWEDIHQIQNDNIELGYITVLPTFKDTNMVKNTYFIVVGLSQSGIGVSCKNIEDI